MWDCHRAVQDEHDSRGYLHGPAGESIDSRPVVLPSGRVLFSFPSQKLCEKEGAADEIVAGFLAGRQAHDVMEALGKLSRHSAENWSEEIYERTSAEPSSPLPALPSSRCNAKRAALERSLSCP